MDSLKPLRPMQSAQTVTLPMPTPYTVVIDTREQLSYGFSRPLPGKSDRHTLAVQTTIGTLATGDYSLAGYEDKIAVERKSIADLFGTLGRGRDRFVRELERMSTMKFCAVVVEAEWSEVLTLPPARAKLSPRSIFGSVIAWQVRYPSVHWMFLPGREVAEMYVAKLLDRWWLEIQPPAELAG